MWGCANGAHAASGSLLSVHSIAAAKILDALARPPRLPSRDYLLASRRTHMALNRLRNDPRCLWPEGPRAARGLSAQRPRARARRPIRRHARSALSGQRDSRSRIRRRLSFLDRRFIGELILRNFLLRRDAQRRRRSPRPLWHRLQRLRHPRTAVLSESLRERKISISGELGAER